MPIEVYREEVWVCGFIHFRVVTGSRRDERRIERPIVAMSFMVEYIPPALTYRSDKDRNMDIPRLLTVFHLQYQIPKD